jgi:hypothetical protein
MPPISAPARPPDEDRLRMTSLVGTLAASAVVVAFFLPWVRVAPDVATRFEARMRADLADPVGRPSERAEDWRRLAASVAREGTTAGVDVFYWARTARADSETPVAARGLLVLAIVLGGVPLAGLLLAGYFVAHRFRRARSPALVLAMLVGGAAVAIASAYGILRGALEQETDPGPGLTVLLVAGAALALGGAFGVRARNWWRVLGGAAVSGAALAGLAYAYVRWGGLA